MKISCPDCQASYDVDLPDLPKEGTQVKCAKCQQSFLVTPEDSEESSLELDSMLDDLIESDIEPNTETTAEGDTEETPLSLNDGEEPEFDTMAAMDSGSGL